MRRTTVLLVLLLATIAQATSVPEGNSVRAVVHPLTDTDGLTNVVPDNGDGAGIWVWVDIPGLLPNGLPDGTVTHLLPEPLAFAGTDLTTAAACQTLASCKPSSCLCLVTTVLPASLNVLPAGTGNMTAVATVRWCWHDGNNNLQCGERATQILIVRRPVAVAVPTPTPNLTPD